MINVDDADNDTISGCVLFAWFFDRSHTTETKLGESGGRGIRGLADDAELVDPEIIGQDHKKY